MEDIKFCNKCGNKLPEGGRFCPRCGNEIYKKSNNCIEDNDEKEDISSESNKKLKEQTENISVESEKNNTETIQNQISVENINEANYSNVDSTDNKMTDKRKSIRVTGIIAIIAIVAVVGIAILLINPKEKESNNVDTIGKGFDDSALENNVSETPEPEPKEIRREEITDDLILREKSYYPSGAIQSEITKEYFETGVIKSEKSEYFLEGFTSGLLMIDYFEPRGSYQDGVITTRVMGENSIGQTGMVECQYGAKWSLEAYKVYDKLKTKVEESTFYEYDSAGNCIKSTYNNDGTTIIRKCEYDKYNVLVSKSEEITINGKTNEGIYNYSYDFDDEGLPKVRYEYLNGKLYATEEITRDNNGLITKIKRISDDGKETITEYERCFKEDIKENNKSVSQEKNDSSDNYISKCKRLFEDISGGKETVFLANDGNNKFALIPIEPSSDNNNSTYVLYGTEFRGIYETDCVNIEGNTFYFSYEENGKTYKFYFEKNGNDIEVFCDPSLIVAGSNSLGKFNYVTGKIEQDDTNNEEKKRIEINKIIASSELNVKSKDGATYHVQNLIDGKMETAWVEGVDGTGIGETVYLEFDEIKKISEMDVYPGFLKTKYRYTVNGQPTKLLIEWDGGQTELFLNRIDAGMNEEPFETKELPVEKLNFEKPAETSFIKLTILESVRGSKYEDIAISEIVIFEDSDE